MRFIGRLIHGTVALAVLFALASSGALGQTSTATSHHDVVIKNAVVMTVTHGNIKNGSIYIKDGKIAAVGETVNAPASAAVIDAGGKYVTPGIVDSHSHIALDDDVNEATSPITPHMMMKDAFDYQDKAIYLALAGGVTSQLCWTAAANKRGGDGWGTKIRMGEGRDPSLPPKAPRSINLGSGK